MRILKKALTLSDIVLSWAVYGISFLVPRDKNLWVFVGWHGDSKSEIFADNAKYFFLYAAEHLHDRKAIWIAKDKNLAQELKKNGYQSHTHRTIKGAWYSLRAGYTFLDAFIQRENFRYSGGTVLVQLLHGRSLKKYGYGKKQRRNYRFIFGPSKFSIELLPESFKTKSKIIVSGYSRCDVFFGDIKGAEIGTNQKLLENLRRIKEARGERAILYMPTYRRGEENFDIEKILDPTILNPYLESENTHFFIKLHPKFASRKYSTSHPNIHFVEESDIYPALPNFDVFVTDYSSVFGDFLLLDKPIILYPYDLAQYKEKEGFILDYETYMPGPRAYTPGELITALKASLASPSAYSQKFGKIKNLYHEHADGGASKRISVELLGSNEF